MHGSESQVMTVASQVMHVPLLGAGRFSCGRQAGPGSHRRAAASAFGSGRCLITCNADVLKWWNRKQSPN